MQQPCKICNSNADIFEYDGSQAFTITCPRCGKFTIYKGALSMFDRSDEKDKVLSVSFWINRHQNETSHLFIEIETMRELLVPFVPLKPIEQANNLLCWIGENIVTISGSTNEPITNLLSTVGASIGTDIIYLADFLKGQGYISHSGFAQTFYEGRHLPPIPLLIAQMTVKGWEKLDEIRRSNKESTFAFMAMKFSNAILERIFMDVIKPAIRETGYDIRKLDQEKRAGLIDDKLRVEIRRSKFLIADLSDDNNGAYWEAGYAEGLGMPVIYICEESKFNQKATHFDTNHHLTVKWKDNPDSLKAFAEELKATIRATFPAEAKMED